MRLTAYTRGILALPVLKNGSRQAEGGEDVNVMTENKVLVLIEVKGADRDNSDSDLKMRLGKEWQAQANQLSRETGMKYRYMMVFNDNAPEGAYTLAEAVKIVGQL
jgi:type III restriction enzyme